MDWQNIIPVLKKGAKMDKQGHHMDPYAKKLYANPNSKILYKSALSTNLIEMAGLGQTTTSTIFDQIRTGELFPDQIIGYSTKSILVGLLILMILKAH